MESGKRLKVEVDRLSNLPDDLIYKILSYIDIVYSIRLSVVSSRWRFIWTSMPTLIFRGHDYEFVNNVLSGRNNMIDESYVSLDLADAWNINHDLSNFRILECEFSHNLTKLHLRDVKLYNCSSSLAMCQNLKNLTLDRCKVSQPDDDSGHFTITNSRLLSLKLRKVDWFVDFVYVCTPQLKHLIFVDNPHSEEVAYYDDYDDYDNWIVSEFSGELAISAPGLTYLRIKGSYIPKLSLDGFPSLEMVDLCISSPQKTDVHKIHDMFQRFNSVISLALSLEIVEILSTSEEVISHQPSPFPSLESLMIYPLEGVKMETILFMDLGTYQLKSTLEMFETQLDEEQEAMKIKLSAEVTNYLLNSTSNATFTTVSYEEARAIEITKVAYRLMEDLSMILEETEAKFELQKTLADSRWDDYKLKVTEMIFCELNNIKLLLTKVLASKRVEMQSSFTRLSTKSNTFVNKMVADIKNQWDLKQQIFSGYFDEIDSSP